MAAKVLVVDDEEFVLQMTVRMILALGYEAKAASSGSDAIAIAQKELPDVILTDFFIPDFGGEDLIKAFKELPYEPLIIVMSSGSFRANFSTTSITEDNPILQKAMKAGANAAIGKPIRREHMQDLLSNLLVGR